MSQPRVLLLALLLAGSAASSLPEAPSREQIAQWIKELGDGKFAVREEASKKLYNAGAAAEAALVQAAKSDDAEVRRRAEEILDKFRWGIYPDTPVQIVDLIQA